MIVDVRVAGLDADADTLTVELLENDLEVGFNGILDVKLCRDIVVIGNIENRCVAKITIIAISKLFCYDGGVAGGCRK